MDGPVTDIPDESYWNQRAQYIAATYDTTGQEYGERFLRQIEKLKHVKQDDEVYLWFEDDLFCQVNMWFAVRVLSNVGITNLYRVFPEPDDLQWMGFGKSDATELQQCFLRATPFEAGDIEFISKLWSAYVNQDRNELIRIGTMKCGGIRFLDQVIQAHVDRLQVNGTGSRPKRVLQEIIAGGAKTFPEIFSQFYLREGIYGYGDEQVKNMLDEMG
jgi:hypothetical protein